MRKNKKFFSCYLIGDDHLLIQCVKIILEKKHTVLGIISPLAAAQQIALEHHISYHESLENATQNLLTTKYDYLFSVINASILPVTILQRARLLSINFHNAPLPQYAGVHALSWAILNNEKQYGVTWHVMTERIDGGDILKQAIFPVDPHETALSLSLKCYTHALSLFSELIDELTENINDRIQQDLTQSSYYSFKHKPAGNGWISWQDSAQNIERMVRALDLGHTHHNRLASPKLVLGTSAYLIKKLHIIDDLSLQKPGTLIKISDASWDVSTQTHLISIEQLSTIEGIPCSLNFLVKKHKLAVGCTLFSPSLQELQEYHALSEHSAASELFWVRTLLAFNAETLPAQLQHNNLYPEQLTAIAQFELTEHHISNWKNILPSLAQPIDVLLSSVFIYLYRLGTRDHTGIWSYRLEAPSVSSVFFTSFIPFSFAFNDTMNFYEAIETIQKARHTYEGRPSFQRDIFYRYPELNSIEQCKHPLAFLITTSDQEIYQIEQNEALILIVFYLDTNAITWFIKSSLIDKEPLIVAIIKNCCHYLKMLLNTLPATISTPISKLPIMNEKERNKILNQWCTITTNYPSKATTFELFEKQVKHTPELTAVMYGKKSLSFSELNSKANQLARYLQKRGLGLNARAAICTTQELHMIIGILAILKTGAAYVPIDASYPKRHIHHILEDSNPSLLIASDHLNEKIKKECVQLNIPILLFSELVKFTEQQSKDNLQSTPSSEKSPAYVMYTSGSTGKPKGVIVTHQGINRLVNNTNYIQITTNDRIAQAASISFDAATFEIWGALLNGATLVAVPHETLLNPHSFATFLEKKEITVLWLTSALFNQYVCHDPSMFRHLTYLLVGGDILNKERILDVLECKQGSPKILLNGYGPTENTTFTTIHQITKEDKKWATIPIGKPIANTSVYILDNLMQPTPVGGIGELYTGGDGLALGYLNQPDLTQKKFIRSPFNSNEKSILYRTGDSVRWLPNSQIEYLGRQDNQVKIRGFRVELEAIQAHLEQHNTIDECCVRTENINNQTKVLVAYMVCNREISNKELQNYLCTQLPNYMIPNFFVRLNKMPLTANGKVDYKKLPKPDFNKSTITHSDFIAPSTSTEQALATLWGSLLGCNTIGIDDNFFDLGGHSLLITQLILKINALYNIDLPLHEFLESPTIKKLSQLIDGNKIIITAAEPPVQLSIDRLLPEEIQINGLTQASSKPEHVLLTGSSGFLGAHLLNELYHTSKSTIYCLIRANNIEEAITRLNATFTKYHLDIQCNTRIVPLVGDLTQPLLGLTPEQFNSIANRIDLIIHNGAAVNHLYNYDLLRAANVLSTLDIMRLATLCKIKPIHYVSTLSAASHFLDESNRIIERFIDSNQGNPPPSDGYSQTKWVSEQLLAEGSRRGLPVNIYRPGWIVGQTKTGAINALSNHLFMLLKGCIQLQVAPKWDIVLDMLPVDIVSTLITHTALQSKLSGTVFNLINPHKLSWTDLIHYINQRGYSVSLINPDVWKEKHLKFINKDNALYSLYPLYINNQQGDWMKGLSTIFQANYYNTDKAFTAMKQLVPPINKALLDTYFCYLENQEFLSIRN